MDETESSEGPGQNPETAESLPDQRRPGLRIIETEQPSGITTAQELLIQYERDVRPQPQGEILQTRGIAAFDVYNVTAPVEVEGKRIIAGRVESHTDEAKSRAVFFEEKNDTWTPLAEARRFRLQDPAITKIGNEYVFTGVRVLPDQRDPEHLVWRTVFYRGTNLNNLQEFSHSPDIMKDVRLVQLKNGKIAVFTRPQGKVGGRGKIGYTELNSLDELNEHNLAQAEILEGQFNDEEWGGVNQCYLLEDGKIGAIGHIARLDKKRGKHYYAMSFIFDPDTKKATPLRIIAQRSNFPKTDSKRPDLYDIFFPGGIEPQDGSKKLEDNEFVWLYGGISDSHAAKIKIKNPFYRPRLKII